MKYIVTEFSVDSLQVNLNENFHCAWINWVEVGDNTEIRQEEKCLRKISPIKSD